MKSMIKILLATGMLALAPFAAAQGFPTKPVSMVVAFPPGGGSDVLGRAMAKGMQDSLGQPVIVENVVGVGGSLGVLKAANATPDGYTILAGSPLELIYTPLGIAASATSSPSLTKGSRTNSSPSSVRKRTSTKSSAAPRPLSTLGPHCRPRSAPPPRF